MAGRSGSSPEFQRKVRAARRARDTAFLIEALDYPIEAPLAARYLGELGAVEAVPWLLALLASPDPHARAASHGRLETRRNRPSLRPSAPSRGRACREVV